MTSTEPVKSKITGGPVEPLFVTRVLGKYDVQYYRCVETGFIQTENPYWLDEAYKDVICPLDVGYLARGMHMTGLTAAVISANFNPAGQFLDYGGGCGVLVRMMRDAGYDFYRCDPYCQNIFAPYFDFDPATWRGDRKFELLTAYEVFEHMVNPLEDVAKMFEFSDSILFSTEIQPDQVTIRSASDWHYFCPEHGQHIAFNTHASLTRIAEHFGAKLHTDGRSIHLLTRRPTELKNPMPPAPQRSTLQMQDHAMIMGKIRENFSRNGAGPSQ